MSPNLQCVHSYASVVGKPKWWHKLGSRVFASNSLHQSVRLYFCPLYPLLNCYSQKCPKLYSEHGILFTPLAFSLFVNIVSFFLELFKVVPFKHCYLMGDVLLHDTSILIAVFVKFNCSLDDVHSLINRVILFLVRLRRHTPTFFFSTY